MALESFPPITLVAVRFSLAGLLMVALAKAAGLRFPEGRELAYTAANGAFMLGGSILCLGYAEQIIPSFLAALFIAISPFWMLGFEAVIPGGAPLRISTLIGMLVGLSGAMLLFAPDLIEKGFAGASWQGFLLLQIGSACWCLGSIIQKRRGGHGGHPFSNGAVQQLAAGVAFILPALIAPGQTIHWSARGLGGMAWLIVFGSVVAYGSYVYALANLPVALVSIYTYVNPAVAALLGWLFYSERFGPREAVSMLVIFVGVGIVKWANSGATPAPEPLRPALRQSSEEPSETRTR
jgi:drug/metabolite transporter (DMT)-like permease